MAIIELIRAPKFKIMFRSIADYDRINKKFETKLVFRLGSDSGFFSEINNMVLAMIYCIENSMQFQLCSKNASYSSDGWLDFFEPFTVHLADKFNLKFNWRAYRFPAFDGAFLDQVMRKRGIENTLLTQHIWDQLRDEAFYPFDRQITTPYTEGRLGEVASNIVEIIWRLNSRTKMKVDELLSSIEIPKNYVAMHIRRGDKNSEYVYTQISTYFEELDGIAQAKNLPIFIGSDDHTVLKEIKDTYPEKKIFHFHFPDNLGFSMNKFSKNSKKGKYDQIIRLLADIELMGKSDVFIGTPSSNVGLFIAVLRCWKQTYGFDVTPQRSAS